MSVCSALALLILLVSTEERLRVADNTQVLGPSPDQSSKTGERPRVVDCSFAVDQPTDSLAELRLHDGGHMLQDD